jgi:hypothetical protein
MIAVSYALNTGVWEKSRATDATNHWEVAVIGMTAASVEMAPAQDLDAMTQILPTKNKKYL